MLTAVPVANHTELNSKLGTSDHAHLIVKGRLGNSELYSYIDTSMQQEQRNAFCSLIVHSFCYLHKATSCRRS